MARQAGLRTGRGVIYINETGARDVGEGGAYIVETSGSALQTVTITSTSSVGVGKGAGKIFNVSVSGAVGVGKLAGKMFSVLASATVSASRSFSAIVSVSSAAVASILRTASKVVSVAPAISAGFVKAIAKHLAASSPISLSLFAGNVFTKTVTASVTATPGIVRAVAKLVAIGVSAALGVVANPTFLGVSNVNHAQAVSTACAASVTARWSWAVRVVKACSAAVTVKVMAAHARLISIAMLCVTKPTYHTVKTLQVPGGVSISLPPIWRQVSKRLSPIASAAVVLTSRSAGKPVLTAPTIAVAMGRHTGHLVVSLPTATWSLVRHVAHSMRWAPAIAVSAFPGSGHLQAVVVAVASSVTVTRIAAHLRSIAVSSPVAVAILHPRTVAKLVSIAGFGAVSIARGIAKSVFSSPRIKVRTSELAAAVPQPNTAGTVTVTWQQGARDILKV